jgi:hypothetical protein
VITVLLIRTDFFVMAQYINTQYPILGLYHNRIYHRSIHEQVCLYKRLQRNHRTLENSAC